MLFLLAGYVQADVASHAEADALMAEAARLAPAAEAVVMSVGAVSPAEYVTKGSWSAVIPWTPHIPTSAAMLPDGRLLTFASNQRTTFPDGPQFTYAAVWDPATGLFTEINNGRHDMFCGGLSFLQDGRLLVSGGNGINGRTALASLFDWRTNEWVPAQTMADGRWYNTSISLPNGEVLTAGGNGGSNGNGTIEQWNASSGWRRMSGINWQAVANPSTANAIETNWHPFFLLAPDGRVSHFGPHQSLNWITATGTGVMTAAGASIPGTHYPKQGAWAMYAPGKVIVTGGLTAIDGGVVVNKAFTVDLNGTAPVVAPAAPMANARSFANSVMLPNGEVMIVGGNTSGQFFSDVGTVYSPEIWNPTTGQWRAVADLTVPRNYHSLAMLLPDGRVWSGGGGLSGDPLTDHQDAQIFTPPQLFNTDGTPAVRPVITAAPDRISPASIFTVNASSGVQYFSAISMSGLTHSVSTGLRHVRFTHTNPSEGLYAVTAPSSINVLTPGYWMMFAVDANGVWSVSHIIQVTNSTLPVVTNPGQQSLEQNSVLSLPISASATGGTLNYSASGLPTGLGIDAGTGLISGTVTATPGTYRSTVLVSAAGQVASITFNWIVVLPNLGTGQIMREYWTEMNGTTVASLTGSTLFPANPNGRDLLASFNAPSNWDDNIGQRLRGFLYVPVTGQYRFYITSDDASSLKLSTDANPANAVEIASQPAWTPPDTWTWYPQQTSALITLQAGKRYYTEALMKEGASDDHLTVGWKKPGDTVIEVIGGTYLSPYLPVDNPVVAWSFDEASWNGTAGEVKSTAASLFAINGSASGGANTTTTNPALSGNPGTGSSAQFNGTSQSVVMPYSASLNPKDFTVAAWVRSDAALGAARCILASRDESTATKKGYGLWVTADGFWQVRTGADTTGLKGSAVTVGQWTHVAATFRTTSVSGTTLTGVRRLYINGILVNEDVGTYIPNTAKPLVIGAADSPGTAFFVGAVDEFALQQAPLSQPDILALRDLRHVISTAVNQSPQITNPGAQASLVGAVVSLPVSASDPENDLITFSATGLPAGLSISAGSGVISGSVTTAGAFNVSVSATDGISTPATAAFTWIVTAGLTLQPLAAAPKATGGALTFTAQSANGINPRYKWNFGDGTPETDWLTTTSITHTYAGPGRYLVTLTATDDTGITITSTFYQAVYAALTTLKPAASSSIVYEHPATGNDRVWCVNPDNDSVTAFDVVTRARYAEITVGTAPRSLALAPDGRLWVTNVEAATISIINPTTRTVASTVTLAHGSRPFGIVFDPAGTAAWVALESTGRVLKLNPSTGAQLASVDAGGPVRHLSISADSARVYASRFITPRVAGENTATPILTGTGGQVVVIGTTALAVERTILLNPSTAADTSTSARGLPNYLGAAVISPDGLSAWVPSKQDNIQRGVLRDGLPMNHENSVRAIVSRIDLTTQAESLPSRVDIDNAGMPSAAAYDPYGIYVFTALEASREVAILDAWSHQEIMRFPAGRAPQGVVTSPDGSTLYVQNFMDRTITVHDVSGILQGAGTAPVTTATLSAVTTEKLTAQVLQGKQLFYDAQDPRLALQQYVSCAVCHNDAGHDGRVWDMTGFGEGLRNTITLKGHANHGMLHWSGNFDEVQDFEGQIRTFSGGTGLMTDTQFNTGTSNQPLGDPKAGVSADLDALAAYVKSLTVSGTSPSRTAGGALSTAASAGQQVFRSQNCASCHGGVNFTNSALNVFADIGTIKPASGKRLGAALTGLDVPTLRGSWATGPYLHDGSAATLSDAITAHQGVTLSATDLSNLAAFVASIDDAPATAPLPFTLTLATAATTVTASFNVTVTFSSVATGFTLSDMVVTNGVASTFSGSGTSYTFKVQPTATGVVTVSVPAGAATDGTSLGNSVSNLLSVNYAPTDITPPTVVLSTPSSSVSAPFVVTATFSENVTGLIASKIAVTNGTVTALSSAGVVYSATITPTAAGAVTVSLPAGMVQDAAGNLNTVSNSLSATYTPVVVVPVVKIQAEDFDEGGEGVAYHDAEAINLGEYVSGLHYRDTGVDIEPSRDTDGTPSIGWIAPGEWLRYTTVLSAGTYSINVRASTPFAGPVPVRVLINGTLATTINLTNSGSFYSWKTFTATGVNVANTGPAVVRLEFPDGNLNFNWMEFVNTTSIPDTTPPAVVLATVSTSVSAPFTVSAAFSEVVTGVALNDFMVTNGVASALSGSGSSYSVTITPAANGAVTVAMPVGAAFDASSNVSLASNTLSVTYTAPVLPAPTVLLSTASSSVTGAFTVNAVFSQSVTGVELNDFILTNGVASALTGSGATYSILVTPAAVGAVTVSVPASAATNATGGANTVSNLLTATYALPDTTPPTVTLSTPATSVTGAFVVTATFSESVTGLLASNFAVTNGTVIALSSTGVVYSATVTPTAAGDVTVSLPAGMAQDAADNQSLASNLITVNYAPVVLTNGLTGDFYIGKNFEQFSFTRLEPTLNYAWGTGSPDPRLPVDGFSVRWHGYLIPRYTQTYTIIPVTDDGVRLWVNGQLIVNDWNNHGDTWNNGVIALQAGVAVSIVMEYYESTGGATARLFWESPGQTREVIPQSQLLVNAPGAAPAASPSSITLTSVIPSTLSLTNNLATTNSDKDGASDLLETALGISLTSGITHPGEGLQLVTRNNNSVDATLLRPSGQGTFTFTLESSSDLINWAPLDVTPTVVSQGNGRERVTWADLQSLPGQSLASGIIRLRVTQSGGASTASTPVGWQQTTLNSGTQSYGLNLSHEALFTGSLSAANASSVTLGEQAAVASAMDPAQYYYLEIISGPQVGHRLDLQSITASECFIAADSSNTTLSASAIAGLSGARVCLRPHRTMGEVFDPALFKGSSVATSADQILFYAPAGYSTYWLYASGGAWKWVLSGDTLASMNDTIMPPGTGVMLQIASSSPAPLLTTGSVRTTPFARPLQTGYNLFANPWPLDTTPAQAGLNSTAIVASTAFSSADQFQLWKGDATPAASGYLGYWLFQMPGQPVPMWISMGDASLHSQNNATLLRAGRATFIKAQPRANRAVWIIPPP
ncbi:MAG: putative Ig domain-containing protein [Prosthecobacter sp.]|uniref:Ig-like domain-containing protein n=1 Tax=Prosthecobacter sp. TaxID=1965333 RepID=UPI0025EA8FFC|nr:Ig-like domain-containing protein [Prosthecobacter sp.]MCF7784919.1 putative Ig domain-containing protein [Prosthecobacter sp.]